MERWAEEGVVPGGGAGEDGVRGFEERRGVRLPADVRAYFLHLDGGAAPGGGPAMDRDLIRFWPLDEVSTLAQAWVPAPEADRWFVLADYSLWAWAYAIRLSADPAAPAPVAVSLGGAELVPLAPTFAEFVEMYLRRDPLVISPDQPMQRG